jgi:hypothetical protein
MQICGFTPVTGYPGTDLTIRLRDVPADTSTTNTFVLLCGQLTPVKNVVVEADGTAIVIVTVGASAQSGEIHIVSGTARMDAQSESVFVVDGASSRAAITDIAPRKGPAGTTIVLTGRHLDAVQFVTIGTTSVYVLPTHTSSEIGFVVPWVVHPGSHRIYGRTDSGRLHSPSRFDVIPVER